MGVSLFGGAGMGSHSGRSHLHLQVGVWRGWRPTATLQQLRGTTLKRPAYVQCGTAQQRAWRVSYKTASEKYTFEYKLRWDARWHPEPRLGLNALQAGTRDRDILAPVPYGRAYARFPGDAADPHAMSWSSLGGTTKPGIGVRRVPFGRGSAMRRWVATHLLK